MSDIIDFTETTQTKEMKFASDLCPLFEYRFVKNISCINIQLSLNDWVSNFIKYDDNIYYMDYFYRNYKNHVQQFNQVIKKTKYKKIHVKKALILYNITKSAGHELCSYLCGIYNLYELNILHEYELIIQNTLFNLGECIKSIILLFFTEDKIHIIDDETIAYVDESILYTPPDYKIEKHNKMLLDKLSIYRKIGERKNVCIIKSILDGTNLNTIQKCFGQSYLDLLENAKFEIISPNNQNIVNLYNIINDCENIVISWGCNAWINSIFINKITNVLVLCHKGYSNEYNINYPYNNKQLTLCTPICKKLIMSFDLPSDLTDESTKQICNHINELLN
jgi:hypothetical protein